MVLIEEKLRQDEKRRINQGGLIIPVVELEPALNRLLANRSDFLTNSFYMEIIPEEMYPEPNLENENDNELSDNFEEVKVIQEEAPRHK